MAEVLWASFFAGFVGVTTLDFLARLLSLPQRRRGVGIFKPIG